jgi:hypothetical protein
MLAKLRRTLLAARITGVPAAQPDPRKYRDYELALTAFLGRDRYERAAASADPRAGMRNGYCPTTVKTTAGPITYVRVEERVSPAERLRAEIDEVFAGGLLPQTLVGLRGNLRPNPFTPSQGHDPDPSRLSRNETTHWCDNRYLL